MGDFEVSPEGALGRDKQGREGIALSSRQEERVRDKGARVLKDCVESLVCERCLCWLRAREESLECQGRRWR